MRNYLSHYSSEVKKWRLSTHETTQSLHFNKTITQSQEDGKIDFDKYLHVILPKASIFSHRKIPYIFMFNSYHIILPPVKSNTDMIFTQSNFQLIFVILVYFLSLHIIKISLSCLSVYSVCTMYIVHTIQ